MLVIYHSADLDGICSGAIAKMTFSTARLRGYNYGEPFDIEMEIDKDEQVLMLDVSMPMETLANISKRASCLTLIDHHASVFNDFVKYFEYDEIEGFLFAKDHSIAYKYREGTAACELCWEHWFGGNQPSIVQLLGEYDTWRGYGGDRWNDLVLPFQYGMRSMDFTPETLASMLSFTWESSVGEPPFIAECLEKGNLILKYQAAIDRELMKNAFEARIEGHMAICCVGAYGSIPFVSVYDAERHDLMVGISFDGTNWKLSLRSYKVDCSLIAKAFGGGGHKGAAGCRVSSLWSAINRNL